MNPTDAVKHLVSIAHDERNSDASLGASVRSHLAELNALLKWLGTFSNAGGVNVDTAKVRVLGWTAMGMRDEGIGEYVEKRDFDAAVAGTTQTAQRTFDEC